MAEMGEGRREGEVFRASSYRRFTIFLVCILPRRQRQVAKALPPKSRPWSTCQCLATTPYLACRVLTAQMTVLASHVQQHQTHLFGHIKATVPQVKGCRYSRYVGWPFQHDGNERMVQEKGTNKPSALIGMHCWRPRGKTGIKGLKGGG